MKAPTFEHFNEAWGARVVGAKAKSGIEAQETDRESAFCNVTVLGDRAFVVEDAHRDSRFASSRLVTQVPNIRFYAG